MSIKDQQESQPKIQWKNIGEGWWGPYDPKNPEDEPLLHLSFTDSEGEILISTTIPVHASKETLEEGIQSAHKFLQENPNPEDWERLCLRADGTLRHIPTHVR
jgi:hypothetical protein